MELKLYNVYKFRYKEYLKKIKIDPYWCFDGQLIVKEDKDGKLYFRDTYWSSSGDSKKFTLEQALEQGELTFVCNLNDIEKCEKYELNYFADEDLFDLSRQHSCYREYYKRKGAKKSADKMEKVLKRKINSLQNSIEFEQNKLKAAKERLEQLQNGDINIYI